MYIIYIFNANEGERTHGETHLADQIAFYDESLKKQIEGSYVTDGKEIHVRSASYGIKSAHYRQVGAAVDRDALDLLAQKLLSELARDAGTDMKSH